MFSTYSNPKPWWSENVNHEETFVEKMKGGKSVFYHGHEKRNINNNITTKRGEGSERLGRKKSNEWRIIKAK